MEVINFYDVFELDGDGIEVFIGRASISSRSIRYHDDDAISVLKKHGISASRVVWIGSCAKSPLQSGFYFEPQRRN